MPGPASRNGPASTTRTASEFPAGQDGTYAWSAAFISYVMRIDGAGPKFPYAISHSTYINAARTGGYALTAMRPDRLRARCPAT